MPRRDCCTGFSLKLQWKTPEKKKRFYSVNQMVLHRTLWFEVLCLGKWFSMHHERIPLQAKEHFWVLLIWHRWQKIWGTSDAIWWHHTTIRGPVLYYKLHIELHDKSFPDFNKLMIYSWLKSPVSLRSGWKKEVPQKLRNYPPPPSSGFHLLVGGDYPDSAPGHW